MITRDIWLIGLTSTGMIMWSLFGSSSPERRSLVIGVGIYSVLILVPGLARPLIQVTGAVPASALLLSIWLDNIQVRGGKYRLYSIFLGAILLFPALFDFATIIKPTIDKYSPCGWNWKSRWDPAWPQRLGGVLPISIAQADVVLAVRTVESISKKGDYIYVGAPWHMHVCFLADRHGLPPYPTNSIVATSSQRAEVLASLAKYRPSVALMSEEGIDIPYNVEHKEEAEYIRANYSLYLKTGSLMIYKRKEIFTSKVKGTRG